MQLDWSCVKFTSTSLVSNRTSCLDHLLLYWRMTRAIKRQHSLCWNPQGHIAWSTRLIFSAGKAREVAVIILIDFKCICCYHYIKQIKLYTLMCIWKARKQTKVSKPVRCEIFVYWYRNNQEWINIFICVQVVWTRTPDVLASLCRALSPKWYKKCFWI